MNYSLSNGDINKLLDGKCNIMSYDQLNNYNNIDSAMGKYGALVLLYQTKQNYGHWCCVFKRNNDTIEFFDPYGLFPDDELEFVPNNMRNVLGEDYPHLTWLLYNSGYKKIDYNSKQLQKFKEDVNTCGRHCVVRIMMRNLSIDEYIKFLGKDPDKKVLELTEK